MATWPDIAVAVEGEPDLLVGVGTDTGGVAGSVVVGQGIVEVAPADGIHHIVNVVALVPRFVVEGTSSLSDDILVLAVKAGLASEAGASVDTVVVGNLHGTMKDNSLDSVMLEDILVQDSPLGLLLDSLCRRYSLVDLDADSVRWKTHVVLGFPSRPGKVVAFVEVWQN